MKLECKYVFYHAVRNGRERESVLTIETVSSRTQQPCIVDMHIRIMAKRQLMDDGYENVVIDCVEDI